MSKAVRADGMTADDLVRDVSAWITENRNARPSWIHIAERLSTYSDMAPAWRELAKRDIRGRIVMSMAIDAADCAGSECRRTLSSAEEAKRLRAVEDAAQKLITAITRAPHLDIAYPIEIDGKVMSFAWRPSGTATAKYCLPESVVELTALLEFAATRAADLRQGKLGRIVKRQRADPVAVAFVRNLASKLRTETGEKMIGTIARIATAALDRREPITKQQVESFLRKQSE